MTIMNEQEFLTGTGLEAPTLRVWLEQQWLIPEQTQAGMQFSAIDLARARLIQDLQADLGVNDEGVDVILHLLDQLHGMRHALATLRRELQEP